MQESPQALHDAYSRACTRSGLGALVIAAFSIMTFLRALDYQTYSAALEYAEAGQRLEAGLREIQQHACRPEDAADLTLADYFLLECQGDEAQILTFDRRERMRGITSMWGLLPSGLPEEPVVFNAAAVLVVEALRQLRRDDLRAAAQSISLDYQLRISEWVNQWSSFQDSPIAPRDLPPSDEFNIQTNVANLELLAESFPLDVADVETLAGRYQLRIPAVGIEGNLLQTAALLYAMALVLCLHFWANLRAAMDVPGFPAPGTMLYVFHARRLARVALHVLIWSTGIASCLLLIQPFAWNWIAFLAWVPILAACVDVSASLAFQKSTLT